MPIRDFPDEWYEQAAVIDWVSLQHPWLTDHIIYIMADLKCSARVGNMLNKMGRKKGRCDLFFAYPNKSKFGLFIEMKTLTGKPTKEQLEFIKRMNNFNYYACVSYGADAAIEIIKKYLANEL